MSLSGCATVSEVRTPKDAAQPTRWAPLGRSLQVFRLNTRETLAAWRSPIRLSISVTHPTPSAQHVPLNANTSVGSQQTAGKKNPAKPPARGISLCVWRETRDSNPGDAINVRRFSRPVHSTTLPISLVHHEIIIAHPVSAGAIIPE